MKKLASAAVLLLFVGGGVFAQTTPETPQPTPSTPEAAQPAQPPEGTPLCTRSRSAPTVST